MEFFPANVYMATSPPRDPAGSPSIETGGDAAHDYRASAAERRTVGPGDVSVSRQLQNAKLLGQQPAIAFLDRVFGPLIEVAIPAWTVIGRSRRDPSKGVVRSMPATTLGGT